MNNSIKPVHVPKHRKILKQCGARMATLYLKNRGYSPEDVIRLLYGREPSAVVLPPSVLSSPAPVTTRN